MNDTQDFILKSAKGSKCIPIAEAHFKLMNYDVENTGVEKILPAYSNNSKFSKSDMHSNAIRCYLQNIPDLLVSRVNQKIVQSIFVECKYLGRTFINCLEDLSYQYYWQYRNIIYSDKIINSINHLFSDDCHNNEFKYFKLLTGHDLDSKEEIWESSSEFWRASSKFSNEWSKYEGDIPIEQKKFVYDYFISDYIFPNGSYFYEDVKVPCIIYLLVDESNMKNMILTLQQYLHHLQTILKEYNNWAASNDEHIYMEELESLIKCYKRLIESKDIPNVFVNYSFLPFWVPANCDILEKNNSEYFTGFSSKYEKIKVALLEK